MFEAKVVVGVLRRILFALIRSEGLVLSLTPEQRATIEWAASIEGTTAAALTVAVVMKRAFGAVYRAKSLALPVEAWDEFIRVPDSGPAVRDAIIDLITKPSSLEVLTRLRIYGRSLPGTIPPRSTAGESKIEEWPATLGPGRKPPRSR